MSEMMAQRRWVLIDLQAGNKDRKGFRADEIVGKDCCGIFLPEDET